MQQGYIADRVAGWYDPTKWFEGELVIGTLGGVRKAKSKPLLVHTYRCVQCGYLVSYATKHSPENRTSTIRPYRANGAS